MPTATDYDNFATQLEAAAERMTGVVTNLPVMADVTIMQGTEIEAIVIGAVEAGKQNATTAGTQIATLAELCRVRAEVCRGYDRAYSAYLGAMGRYRSMAMNAEPGEYIGSPPYPPIPPAPWVERSI